MKAVLFDLDDTLLDYSGGVPAHWASACRAAADAAGVACDELIAAVEAARRWFWSCPVRHARERVRMLNAWQQIAAHALAGLGVVNDPLARRIAEDFHARRRAAARLFDDALPCLDALRARDLRLGLVTNGDAAMQRDKIALHDLARHFGAIVIEGELGTGKPDPAVFRHALARLGVAAGDAVMIGDNLDWDVDGPQRIGIAGVWLDRPAAGLPAATAVRPARIVHGLDAFVAGF